MQYRKVERCIALVSALLLVLTGCSQGSGPSGVSTDPDFAVYANAVVEATNQLLEGQAPGTLTVLEVDQPNPDEGEIKVGYAEGSPNTLSFSFNVKYERDNMWSMAETSPGTPFDVVSDLHDANPQSTEAHELLNSRFDAIRQALENSWIEVAQ